jgi:hypothetical protein
LDVGDEQVFDAPSEVGNDHKNLLHACRRHLCSDRASALVRIVMGWSVTLNGVDVPLWPSLVKGGKVQTEQMFSGLHLKADGRRLRVHALV